MGFEFDPNRSAINKAKHGISFVEAQEIWAGVYITVSLGNKHGEERYAVFGKIGEKHWTAIITWRNGNIRFISVRRSRAKEEAYYARKKGNQC